MKSWKSYKTVLKVSARRNSNNCTPKILFFIKSGKSIGKSSKH